MGVERPARREDEVFERGSGVGADVVEVEVAEGGRDGGVGGSG